MNIIPIPQKIEYSNEFLNFNSFSLTFSGFKELDLLSCINYLKSYITVNESSVNINFIKSDSFRDEKYQLNIKSNQIQLIAGNESGIFRGLNTLKQIILQAENNQLQCLEIEDYPHIKKRGIMLDISRGKIPKLETLKELVDIMADLKYNELQLYMESFVFEYSNFKEYCKDTQPLTVLEIKDLINYCECRFIEVVPNQNCFGHMGVWLEKEELNHLAIHTDNAPNTLNPLMPESVEFVDKIFECLLPHFKSDYVNIGFDETFDLGKGETKEEGDKKGTDEIYIEYFLKIYDLITKKYNKKVMLFDDILFKYPKLLAKIPQDCTLLEWGYEAEHHFDRHCNSLKEFKLPYYVSPGTSSWGSLTGRNINMLFNIHNACENGKYHSANGFLLTDWGDNGHMQFSIVSYPAYILGAAFSWNCGSHNTEIAYDERNLLLENALEYLDKFILKNNSEKSMADIIWRLGNYYLLEQTPFFNNTKTSRLLLLSKNNPELLKNEISSRYLNIANYVAEIEKELADFDNTTAQELKLSCKMVYFHAKALEFFILKYQGKTLPNTDILFEILNTIKPKFKQLWEIKNHTIGSNIYIDFLDEVGERIT